MTALGAAQGGIGYLAGGYGNLLEQIARRNYPNYSAGFSLNIPLRNRAAQADYVTSLIEIRQNELNLQKNINQVRVDVHSAVIGLQQARVRFDAAVKARILQQQTLDADQRKYALGRGNRVSGGAGPARSGQCAELGSAGDGELQPRQDHFRPGAGDYARSESCIARRGEIGQGGDELREGGPVIMRYIALLLCGTVAWAQTSAIEPVRPTG